MPVVLAGDLNVESGQRAAAEAVLDADLVTAGHSFDTVTNRLAAKSAPPGYRESLDYLGAFRRPVRPRFGPVSTVPFGGDTIPSDHYPVMARIEY